MGCRDAVGRGSDSHRRRRSRSATGGSPSGTDRIPPGRGGSDPAQDRRGPGAFRFGRRDDPLRGGCSRRRSPAILAGTLVRSSSSCGERRSQSRGVGPGTGDPPGLRGGPGCGDRRPAGMRRTDRRRWADDLRPEGSGRRLAPPSPALPIHPGRNPGTASGGFRSGYPELSAGPSPGATDRRRLSGDAGLSAIGMHASDGPFGLSRGIDRPRRPTDPVAPGGEDRFRRGLGRRGSGLPRPRGSPAVAGPGCSDVYGVDRRPAPGPTRPIDRSAGFGLSPPDRPLPPPCRSGVVSTQLRGAGRPAHRRRRDAKPYRPLCRPSGRRGRRSGTRRPAGHPSVGGGILRILEARRPGRLAGAHADHRGRDDRRNGGTGLGRPGRTAARRDGGPHHRDGRSLRPGSRRRRSTPPDLAHRRRGRYTSPRFLEETDP